MAKDTHGSNAQRIQLRKIMLVMNHTFPEEAVAKDEDLEAAEEEVSAEVSVAEETTTIMAMDPQVEGTNTQVREAEVNKEQVVPSTAKPTIKTSPKIILTILKIIPVETGTMCIIRR